MGQHKMMLMSQPGSVWVSECGVVTEYGHFKIYNRRISSTNAHNCCWSSRAHIYKLITTNQCLCIWHQAFSLVGEPGVVIEDGVVSEGGVVIEDRVVSEPGVVSEVGWSVRVVWCG